MRRTHRLAAATAVIAVVLPLLAPVGARAAAFTLCDAADGSTPTVAQADALLANKYTFFPFSTVTLPSNLTWKENPFHNDSWVLKLHQMFWTEPLWYAYTQTGLTKYRDRYVALLKDWYYNNPTTNPPSPWSWAQHSTAIRAMVVSCAVARGFGYSWMHALADEHGRLLASSSFYLQTGNRALDQDIGLLDIGCVRANTSWKNTAVSRTNAWAVHDVDAQGVSTEQSDGYNSYVYHHLDLAARRMAACGVATSTVTSQDQKMVNFIANAETPFGTFVGFGDTSTGRIPYDWNNRSSILNWMYSNGGPGLSPPTLPLYATFGRGFAFFRSSWGDSGTVNQQTHVMVRFGEGMAQHGHMDSGEVTLEAYGDKLLLDSGGPYVYVATDPYRRYFVSERANNTMSIDGVPMRAPGWTYLHGESHDANMDFVSVWHLKFSGVTTVRHVLYDRRLNVMLVEDALTASGPVAFRQTWHLRQGANPAFVGRYKFYTRSPSGPNVAVTQLFGGKTQEAHTGATNPVQGWLVMPPGKIAAPAVEVKTVGRSARYITLIVPSPAGSTRSATTSNLQVTSTGFSIDVTLGGMTDHIVVSNSSASLTILS